MEATSKLATLPDLKGQTTNPSFGVVMAAEKSKTPAYIYDIAKLRQNYKYFKNLFSRFRIFYSVKTNPLCEVVNTMHSMGSSFDAATIGEVTQLIDQKISASEILFTHPVKSEATVLRALDLGIKLFTFDSLEEYLMLVKLVGPDVRLLLRILPPCEGNFYEYSDKFGASDAEVRQIFEYALKEGTRIDGVSFHVGSQNMSLKPWADTLKYCVSVFNSYYKVLDSFRILNIGSGFPHSYAIGSCPSLLDISLCIDECTKTLPKDIEYWVEPGRVLVADTASLVCSVIRNIKRKKNRWLFVNFGVYHGLIEILESRGKMRYAIQTFKGGNMINYNISGFTLDPDDTILENVALPENLVPGDKLLIRDVGAYTASFFTKYHGFEPPEFIFVDNS